MDNEARARGRHGRAGAERSCPNAGFTIVAPESSLETRPVKNGRQTLFVERKALTTTSDIAEIKLGTRFGDAFVLIKFNPAAAARLLEATTNHDGLKMAFVVDDKVFLAVTWQGPYGIGPEGTQLSIMKGIRRAQRLVDSVRACAGDKRTP